ncbi:MAG TPA: hypothetical protein VH500_03780 [Nitrososphaeraceae archaeon]
MTYKSQIITDLGEKELLIPRLVDQALSANDKVKYFFSLLQMAKERAEDRGNDTGYSNLRDERLAYAIDNDSFDKVIQATVKIGSNRYQIPELRLVLDSILQCIEQMITPLDTASTNIKLQEDENRTNRENDRMTARTTTQSVENPHNYRSRFEKLKKQISPIEYDIVSGKQIEIITSGQREVGDSLHLLVMNLHKELNTLQSKISQESIGGASVYGLTENDRKCVEAFMSGVNETAKLKFDHVGLGTTATRSGEDLIIQNDIGTTDAHVLVLHVKKMKATLTYTDIHIRRLLFFRSLLEKYEIRWNETDSKKSTTNNKNADIYHLSIGVYEAEGEKELYEYLSFLGSRIVFLIDWNRARKSLRNFIKTADCISVLKWAAYNSYGHRAFLQLGGQKLLYEAIRQIDNPPIHYGQELSEVLGRERTVKFLQFVIKTCCENLIEGKSESLVRDRIRAELTTYFHTLEQDVVQIAANHATLLVEIAEAARNTILNSKYHQDQDFSDRNFKRARIWESKADALVKEVRTLTKRPTTNVPRAFEQIIVNADDAADFLEEAVFLMTLLQKENNYNTDNTDFESLSDLLNEIAEKAYQDSMEYLKALENAKVVHRGSPHEDVQDFLEAIDMAIAIEHDVDEVNRHVEEALVTKIKDFRQFHILSETAKNIEGATDSVMKAAILLRDYILGNLSI